MGIPDHLTCLLRNLYAGQEATVGTGHGTIYWYQLGKAIVKAVYCHSAYLTYMQEYIMQNIRLDEAQAGIKIVGRNINDLRYADDTILMAESEEGLKSIFMKMKEENIKIGLKQNILKSQRSWLLVPPLHDN